MTTNDFYRRVLIMRKLSKIPARLRLVWQEKLLKLECQKIDEYLEQLGIESEFDITNRTILINEMKGI